MNFLDFKNAVNIQFSTMASGSALFVTDVTKEELWDTYLKSFPKGTNPIFRERTEHDCQCCKTFIRGGGNVVSIHSIDNEFFLSSIWDIEIGGHYQVVADALSALVKSRAIMGVYTYFQKELGKDFNHEEVDGKVTKWNHFHFQLPNKFVHDGIGNPCMKSKEEKELLQRSLSDISMESLDTVLELIAQNSVYRGEEHEPAISKFKKIKEEMDFPIDDLALDLLLWKKSNSIGPAGRIKNTMIGSLLVDITEGRDLDSAVRSFEEKAHGYKRPISEKIVSKGMIKKAEEKVKELGYLDSLARRPAEIDDITINNVLFANRDAKKAMNVFDELADAVPVDPKTLQRVEEISAENFVKDILPKAENIEVYFENIHENNLMSLVAPLNPSGKNMLKWKNNFSWAYKGEAADSLKNKVFNAGGKVDGVSRYSLIWNEKGEDPNIDFDAHCVEPDNNRIYFDNQGYTHHSSGRLDVDNRRPGNKPGIENIAYSDLKKIKSGKYVYSVHNYSSMDSKGGFVAELEFNGKTHVFEHPRPLRGRETVHVADVDFDRGTGIFTITKSLKSTVTTKKVWGIDSQQFHKVTLIMNSPNHWDGEKTGNRHLFFILDGCRTNEPIRGFFNEFLDENLREHRRVFEMLGSKMKAAATKNQLSGLGFSSTQRASVLCKITGAFTRILKINF